MGKVQIEINQKLYVIGCEDGQEDQVTRLARHLDGHITQLVTDVGQISELKLMLMGALMVCDELHEARSQVSRLEAELARLGEARAVSDEAVVRNGQAARTLREAASRLDAISDRVTAAAAAT